jgi:hypothetical protein
MQRRAKRMKRNDDICPICDEFIDIIHSGYAHETFVDGKTYHAICFTCASTIRSYDGYAYTVKEMVEDGFKQKRVEKSIKAVRASIKKHAK